MKTKSKYAKGGRTTLKRYGVEHMSRIAKKRWRAYRKNLKAKI